MRRKTALEHIGFDRAQRVVRRSVHLVIRMIAVQCLGIHKNSQIVDHILISFAYTDINIAIGP